jgi:nucleotide-binding universal stress UspA family protein
MRHILYCYRPGARADQALRQACRLASRVGAKLSVGIVRQTGPVPSGCCGVSAAKWVEMLDDVDGDDARRARAIARSEEAAPRVIILAGEKPPAVISAYARNEGCDVIALPARSWRPGGSPLSTRTMRQLRELTDCELIELGRGADQLGTPAALIA